MRQYVWIAFAAFTFLVHPLVSFSQTVEPNLSVFKNNQNFQRSQSAVVQITSKAIEDAPSARTLGKVRQGSGVVIGSDGLILTIGYLILETEQIEIRTPPTKNLSCPSGGLRPGYRVWFDQVVDTSSGY
jgi:hypothetical protein